MQCHRLLLARASRRRALPGRRACARCHGCSLSRPGRLTKPRRCPILRLSAHTSIDRPLEPSRRRAAVHGGSRTPSGQPAHATRAGRCRSCHETIPSSRKPAFADRRAIQSSSCAARSTWFPWRSRRPGRKLLCSRHDNSLARVMRVKGIAIFRDFGRQACHERGCRKRLSSSDS